MTPSEKCRCDKYKGCICEVGQQPKPTSQKRTVEIRMTSDCEHLNLEQTDVGPLICRNCGRSFGLINEREPKPTTQPNQPLTNLNAEKRENLREPTSEPKYSVVKVELDKKITENFQLQNKIADLTRELSAEKRRFQEAYDSENAVIRQLRKELETFRAISAQWKLEYNAEAERLSALRTKSKKLLERIKYALDNCTYYEKDHQPDGSYTPTTREVLEAAIAEWEK